MTNIYTSAKKSLEVKSLPDTQWRVKSDDSSLISHHSNLITQSKAPMKKHSSLISYLSTLLVLLLLTISNVGWGQTNPTPHDLSTGSFTFTGFGLGTTTTYPTSMQGWSFGGEPTSAITTDATGDRVLAASTTSATSGSIKNETSSGISLLNSSTNNIGAICIAINTTNRSNILVSWTAAQVGAGGDRSNAIILQYRTGTSGSWTDVASSTYTSNLLITSGIKAAQTFSDISLPSGANNQSIVQLRWLYYVASGTGSRDRIRIDDITISSSAVTPTITTSGSLSAVNTTYGSASSSPTSFTVSGSNLNGTTAVTVTPPAGFQVATSSDFSTTIGTNASPLSLGTGTSISSTTIYVRLANTATVAGSPYSGNIVIAGGGATSVNVATASSTVTAKTLTISGLTAQDKQYDGGTSATVTGTAALAAGGVVNSDVVTLGGTGTFTFASAAVGPRSISTTGYAISGAGAGNYSLSQPSFAANITAKALTITANNDSKTYGQTKTYGAGSTAFSTNVGGLIPGESIGSVTITASGGTAANAAVNTYNLTPSAATGGTNFSASNYSITYNAGTLSVNAAPLTITANNVNKALGATLTGGTGSTAFSSTGLQNSETIGSVTITYGSGAAAGDAAGVYAESVTPSAATGGTFTASNYSITYVPGDINVSSGPTITGATTATAFTTTYGSASAEQSFSISGSGLEDNIVATAPTGFEVSSDGSTYGSTATFTQSSGNASGTLRIRLAATAAVSGSYNGINISLTSTNASTVNITTASTGNSVTAKGLTITGLTATSRDYNGTTSVSVTGTPAYSGLANGETFSVTGTVSWVFGDANAGPNKTLSRSGDYNAPSTNYTVTQPTLTATINTVALTITGLSAADKVYNTTTAVSVSGTPQYSGLVNGETFSVTGTVTWAFPDANVGTNKTLTRTGSYNAPSANYTVTQPTLTASITKASQTITAINPSTINKVVGDAAYSAATSSNSGLTISYSSSNDLVATVNSSGSVTIVGAGTATITASQAGDANYNAATSVTQTLTVTPAVVTLVAWQLSSASGSNTTINATTNNSNLNTSFLSRGDGLVTNSIARSFSSAGYDATTLNESIAQNEFMQFQVQTKAGFKVSLNTLNVRLRRSADGPTNFRWQYSVDGVTFVNVGSSISSTSTVDGVDQTPIDLSAVSALQNVSVASIITFRLYAWNATSSVGSLSIGRYGTSVTTNSLSVTGYVETDPNPYIVPSSNTLTGISYTLGNGPSTASSVTLSAINLTAGGGLITINGSTNYEVSTTGLSNDFGSSKTLNYTGTGTLTSNTVYIRLKAGLSQGTYASETISISGGGGATNITVSGSVAPPPPTNDLCADAITASIGSVNGTTVSSSTSSPFTPATNNDVWYKFTPTCSATYTLSTSTTSQDLDISAYSTSCPLTNSVGITTGLLSSSLTAESVNLAATSGTTYYIRIFNDSETSGSVNGAFTFTIVNPSVSQAVTTSAATLVSGQAATLNGNLTTLGVCPNTIEKGFVYSITSVNSNPVVSATGVTSVSVAGISTGTFSAVVTGLVPNTGYTCRSYVYDGTNYTYGTTRTFSTTSAANWDFGFTLPGTAAATFDPYDNLSLSSISLGNANGSVTMLSTTSAPSSTVYTAASASYNAGTAAAGGGLNTNSNAYFQFTVTPTANFAFSLRAISFGSRSTGTGPTKYSLRSSLNNYSSEIVGGTMLPDVWDLESASDLNIVSQVGTPITFRIYGYDATGNTVINWRIDDLTLTLTEFTPGVISTTGESICYQVQPNNAIGNTTSASGGGGSIAYTWRSSADGYTNAIDGETSATYTPPAGLESTTSYRRYATSSLFTTPVVSSGTWTVTVNCFRLSYDANGATTGTAPLAQFITTGESATVRSNSGDLQKIGHTFDGWNTLANGSGDNYTAGSGSYTMGSSNATLYAKWNVNSYGLSYDANGGSGTPPTGGDYNFGTQVLVLAPGSGMTKTGYTFNNWNTASDGSGTPYRGDGTESIQIGASATTLYAQWTINKYTVSYDGNGNTGGTEVSPVDYNFGTEITVSGKGSLVRTGYTFAGWNTTANGNGTSYVAGDKFTLGAAPVVLYAQWTINSYTITYFGNTNTGGDVPAQQNYNYDAPVTISGVGTLVKTGHNFAGWNTLANGLGVSYGAGDNFNMPDNNINLYAQWSTGSYTLNYNGNENTGGAAPAGGSYLFGSSQTIQANTGNLVKTGHTFAGWNTEANGSGTDIAATGNVSFTIPAENTTLFAKWTINQYSVSYSGNGSTSGTAPAVSTNYNYDQLITVLGNTYTKTGYTFDGWNTAANGTGTAYEPNQTFNLGAGNVILYAQWVVSQAVADYRTKGAVRFSTASNWEYNAGSGWTQATLPPGNRNNVTILHAATLDLDFTVGSGKTFTISAGSLTINAGKTLNITGTADFGSKSVVLKSTSLGSGAIGQITGTLNNADNVTVERFISNGRRGWRLLTIPVTGTTIRNAWAGVPANPDAPTGETRGIGTLITGHGANYVNGAAAAAEGFDWFGFLDANTTSSIRFYNAAANHWNSATNTPDPLANPTRQGYMLFVRGDRTITNAFGNTTLRPTGTIKQKNQSIPVSNTYEVIGNPYPSPIDLNAVYLNSGNGSLIERNFWVWDASIGTSGGYRAISWSGSAYTMTGGAGDVSDYLKVQSGQAFFVKKQPSGVGNLTIEENDKVNFDAPVQRPYHPGVIKGNIALLNVNLHEATGNSQLLDGVAVRLNNAYEETTDEPYDMAKMNAFNENLSIVRNNRLLSIESRPLPTAKDTVYLSFWNLAARNYTMRINTEDWDDKIESATLIDRLTNKSVSIDINNGSADFNFTVSNPAQGRSSDRFIIVFKKATPAVAPVRFTKVEAEKKDAAAIEVRWQSANVTGLKHFEVERSADGMSFSKLNSVAVVNNSATQNYSILDKQPLTGWNYYRIRNVEANGKVSFSNIAKVQWNFNPQIRIYPNVIANGKINILLQDLESGRYQVVLNTLSGQRLYSSNLQHVGGTASYSIELKQGRRNMASGEYFLMIYSNNELKQTEKLIVQ